MRYLDITAVAKRSGVPASALRYYEEKGLIVSVGRRGLRRLFDAAVLERLALIALGQAGLSLDEIARMFTPNGRPRIDRKMLATRPTNWTARSASSRPCAMACGTPPPAPRRATWNARRSAA